MLFVVMVVWLLFVWLLFVVMVVWLWLLFVVMVDAICGHLCYLWLCILYLFKSFEEV